MAEKELVNRIAKSPLITLDLQDYLPPEEDIAQLDLKHYLFKDLILKEDDFREEIKAHDWSQYEDKILLTFCSTDAIIPAWAYMLVASEAQPYVREVYQGDNEAYNLYKLTSKINKIDGADYEDDLIIIKGCSDRPVPPAAYMALTVVLRPHARKIMYGEPCSTVPIYKKPKTSRRSKSPEK